MLQHHHWMHQIDLRRYRWEIWKSTYLQVVPYKATAHFESSIYNNLHDWRSIMYNMVKCLMRWWWMKVWRRWSWHFMTIQIEDREMVWYSNSSTCWMLIFWKLVSFTRQWIWYIDYIILNKEGKDPFTAEQDWLQEWNGRKTVKSFLKIYFLA